MEPADTVDRRLTDLEIKASFSEDLIDRLNEVLVQQQAQIERLQRELAALRAAAVHQRQRRLPQPARRAAAALLTPPPRSACGAPPGGATPMDRQSRAMASAWERGGGLRVAGALLFALQERVQAFDLLARPGVLRSTFRLDEMLGCWLKQRSAMRSARPGQP